MTNIIIINRSSLDDFHALLAVSIFINCYGNDRYNAIGQCALKDQPKVLVRCRKNKQSDTFVVTRCMAESSQIETTGE